MIIFVRVLFVVDSVFFFFYVDFFVFFYNDRKVNYDCRVVKVYSSKFVNCKIVIVDVGSF